MIVRSLDPIHDWTFGSGKNNYLSGANAVAQNIDTRVNSFLGDCFFSTGDGIDWFNLLGAKDQLALNLAISATILNTAFVTSLNQLAVNLNASDRSWTIFYNVSTAYGPATNSISGGGVGLILTTQDGTILTTQTGEVLTT